MAIKNDAPRIVKALKTKYDNVTRGWPSAEATMPCLYVSSAANTPVVFGDDSTHVHQLDYDIRLFAYTADDIDVISDVVDDIMQEELGYTRGLIYDSDSSEIRMRVMRYTIYL
jgi:hypothetical protein